MLLWPMFYAKWIGFYPSQMHSSLMIETFGGAFVVGFLGTAGPRVASAPPFGWRETGGLLLLHELSGVLHLLRYPMAGDIAFALMLGLLLTLLGVRAARSTDEEGPPPQLLLAVSGLLCGIAGALLPWLAHGSDAHWLTGLGRLLLHQGFLLLPTLGIGSFLFPRMLGGDFGDEEEHRTRGMLIALGTAILILASFVIEARGLIAFGNWLRLGVAAAYLLLQIRWRRTPGAEPRGSLVTGLFWAMAMGALALLLIPTKPSQQASIAHLLYIGGFGLLMLVVGSRVLFGHSGDLAGFHRVSKWVRWLVFLAVLAAITRASPAWRPSLTISHHIYGGWTWALLAASWLIWHRKRFFTRDED